MTSWRASLIVFACMGLLAACEREPDTSPPSGDRQIEIPSLTAVDPPLGREELVLALARAASDFAAGREDLEHHRRLDGKRFELRLRFGCETDAPDTRRWTFDERARVVRFRVEPDISRETEQLAELGLESFEAVEGFWIRRPWLLEAACPAPEPPPDAEEEGAADGAAPGEETSAAAEADEAEPPRWPLPGIAQFFTEQDSRLRRRDDRAYQATIPLQEGVAPSTSGYDLVLSGRLRRLPDGRVIACVGRGDDAPPSCIASAAFDHVALERPDGTTLAEWSSG